MTENVLDSSFIPALHKPTSLLPIANHRESLLYLFETSNVVIVTGQTGSGKTTQIPQYLEQAGWCSNGKIIGITQPRRVATTTVALRVAEEVGCAVGEEVGYSVRFDDVTSEATKIKFVTDGLLVREALVDPLLSRYAVLVVDEAHERSISTDILCGLLKKVLKKRKDLCVIISSATLQVEDFSKFFAETEPSTGQEKNDALQSPTTSIVSLEGRSFPIDVLYLEKPAENYVEAAINTVFKIHEEGGDGDILVFLTGREEIDHAVQMIQEHAGQADSGREDILALPLYAGLTTDQQMAVFEPTPSQTRKVVVSTNIAEASVTIDGIVHVVDSGFVKVKAYNPSTSIETLTSVSISKASASQRAGRAGRTRPGKCYRLYTEAAYQSLLAVAVPEIQRSNLAPVVLQLKALGIDNVARFDYLSAPPSQLMSKALELLFALGALDEYAKLTRPLGHRMAELAVEPMMGKTLLSADSFGCLKEMLTIAAMTSLDGSVWFHHEGERKKMESSRRKFAVEEGDHITLLNAYQTFVTKGKKEARFCHEHNLNYKSMVKAVSIRAQLKRYLERFGFIIDDSNASLSKDKDKDGIKIGERISRCLTAGYFAHAARMQPDGTFRNVEGGTTLHAHPSSVMFNRKADWVIFQEVMETGGDKTYIRDITKVQREWLLEYAPEFYKLRDTRK